MKMPNKRAWFRASLAMMLGTHVAYAETLHQASWDAPADADYPTLRQQLAEQAKSLAEQQQRLALEMKKLEEAQRRIQAMQGQLGMPVEIQPQRHLAQAEESTFRGRGNEAGRVDSTTLDVATVFSQPSILTPKGAFVFDPSLQYSFSSSDRVTVVGFSVLNAVLIGDRRAQRQPQQLDRDPGRALRVDQPAGVEARVPYIYRSDDSLSRRISGSAVDESFNSDGNGSATSSWPRATSSTCPRRRPVLYRRPRLKTRTGKDQYEVDYDTDFNLPKELPTAPASTAATQPEHGAARDPVVFFGGINYTWNIKRDVNASIPLPTPWHGHKQIHWRSRSGDSIGLNFGMGLGLNERSSFSLSYEHT